MGIIKVGDKYISVPDDITTIDDGASTSRAQLEARTLNEDEVKKLIEIQKIETGYNPIGFVPGPAAIEMLDRAAKSKKKLPRLVFYILVALLPVSCMEMITYDAASNNRISW